MRSRAILLVGVIVAVTALLGGVTAGSVAAATKTQINWYVYSLTAGQEKFLARVASSNSPGVKTWSKTGSCTLTPKSKPTKLTMGTGKSCTLTLKIAKSGKYSAKKSTAIITRAHDSVGQKGPGGGTIFYVDMTRPEGSQFFEVACLGWSDGTCGGSDLMEPTAGWGCFGTPISGADGTSIGDGEQNTTDIVAGCATAGIAAKVAVDLVLGGQDDWFLPSRDELNQMYIQRMEIGFWLVFYWSSSEFIERYAWARNFSSSAESYFEKDFAGHVRPIRAF